MATNLPEKFTWMDSTDKPKAWAEARRHYGLLELPGKGSNVNIMAWAKEMGVNGWYENDNVPWCGLFAGIVTKRSGYKVPKDHLAARSWVHYGVAVTIPSWFDVGVFARPGGGHVGFLVAQNVNNYLVYGGNQSNAVGLAWIAKHRCIAVRRSPYPTYVPAALKVLTFDGQISTNES